MARGDHRPRVVAFEFRKRNAIWRLERESILCDQTEAGDKDQYRRNHRERDELALHSSTPPSCVFRSSRTMKPDARRTIHQTKVSTTPLYRSTRSSNGLRSGPCARIGS